MRQCEPICSFALACLRRLVGESLLQYWHTLALVDFESEFEVANPPALGYFHTGGTRRDNVSNAMLQG